MDPDATNEDVNQDADTDPVVQVLPTVERVSVPVAYSFAWFLLNHGLYKL